MPRPHALKMVWIGIDSSLEPLSITTPALIFKHTSEKEIGLHHRKSAAALMLSLCVKVLDKQ